MSMLQALLAPLFLHVALVMIVGILSLRSRIAAVRSGRTKLKDTATNNQAWPEDVRKLGNNFDNQFQTPMLWYAVIALLVATGLADGASIALSWAFLLSRVVHSVIHTGSNVVIHRLGAFLVGMTCLTLLWAWFGLRLFSLA